MIKVLVLNRSILFLRQAWTYITWIIFIFSNFRSHLTQIYKLKTEHYLPFFSAKLPLKRLLSFSAHLSWGTETELHTLSYSWLSLTHFSKNSSLGGLGWLKVKWLAEHETGRPSAWNHCTIIFRPVKWIYHDIICH